MAFFSLQGSLPLDFTPCNQSDNGRLWWVGNDVWEYTLPHDLHKILLPVILQCINDNDQVSVCLSNQPWALS